MARCQGKRRIKGALYGICIFCPLHDPVRGVRLILPAYLDPGGVAVCPDRDAALSRQVAGQRGAA